MHYHTEGLTSPQLQVLRNVGAWVSPIQYYLAGGTAISIYFGHRRSVDLDWFTSTPLTDPLQFAQLLRDEGIHFTTTGTERGTLYGTIEDIRVSFLEYRYRLQQPLNFWDEGHCYLASLDDLACMKLAAIAQRGYRKDFIDTFVLVQKYKPLKELIGLYQEKYESGNIAPVLMGLVYFDDADDEPDPPLWSVDWGEVKFQIADWVRRI